MTKKTKNTLLTIGALFIGWQIFKPKGSGIGGIGGWKLSNYAKGLEKKGIEVHFEALPEDRSPRDSFEFEDDIKWVEEQYNSGNDAAWFLAKVWVSWNGVESDPEYLGGNSYKSFSDFTASNGDYFDDMVKSAFENLKGKISTIKSKSATWLK